MGAPVGNNNRAKQFMFKSALERVIQRRSRSEALEEVEALCEKWLDLAKDGDTGAIRDIRDTLDGKPSQAIEGAGGGPVIIQLSADHENL